MKDPYAVLGVSASASDEEVKRAYRDLVKKYHPDNYANNPLADLAEAKMKDINEAYDAIVKMRTQGGYQAPGGGFGGQGAYRPNQGGQTYNAGNNTGNVTFQHIRMLISQNNLDEAERLLRTARINSAEWYYLMGTVAYRRGWMDDARRNFWTASSMEPTNIEYRQAMNSLGMQASRGAYRGGSDLTTLCSTLCCVNMCCDMCN